MKVCWISAGVSSFVAGWLVRGTVDEFIYIDIADQHPDSMRFIHDCEKALGKPIKILKSRQYRCVEDCIRTFGTFRNAHNHFYPCTKWLKKRVRKECEQEHDGQQITYVWGMDLNEKHRADRLVEGMPEFEHEFPLIDRKLTKSEAHGILASLGIKRPVMYELGYSNNNCIGCVRGGDWILEQDSSRLSRSVRLTGEAGTRHRLYHPARQSRTNLAGRARPTQRSNGGGDYGRV